MFTISDTFFISVRPHGFCLVLYRFAVKILRNIFILSVTTSERGSEGRMLF